MDRGIMFPKKMKFKVTVRINHYLKVIKKRIYNNNNNNHVQKTSFETQVIHLNGNY